MPAASPLPDADPGCAMACLRGIVKRFGDKSVLDGVDLDVAPNGITVVIGGSGSGKSTTMRILLGLEPYDAGSARLLGHEVADLSHDEYQRVIMQVGALFQFGALFDSMTVAENVGFALQHVRRMRPAEIQSTVRQNLLMVGLKDVEQLYPSQLSGGMRKRVALARAIAHEPKLLLVDEPTTGLDPVMKETIVELIKQMRDRLGVTVLCITHDIRAAFSMADRIAMLYKGRVVAVGDPDSVRDSEHPAVQQFIHGRAFGPIEP